VVSHFRLTDEPSAGRRAAALGKKQFVVYREPAIPYDLYVEAKAIELFLLPVEELDQRLIAAGDMRSGGGRTAIKLSASCPDAGGMAAFAAGEIICRRGGGADGLSACAPFYESLPEEIWHLTQ